MPVAGPERQSILAVPYLGGTEQLRARDAGVARRPPEVRPAASPAVTVEAAPGGPAPRNPQPAGLPDGRPSAPFLAQLIAQDGESGANTADAAANRLRLRRQLADVTPGTADAEARSRRGSAGLRQESADGSAAAYRQTADVSRAYAVARYGAVRDVAGLYLVDPGVLDITA